MISSISIGARLVALTVGLLSLAQSVQRTEACGVDWSVPRDRFNGVNELGFVSYWDKIGEIDIGENEKFPLVIGFQSDRERSSPYLGYGWVMPLLDSYMVQKDENNFEIMKPGGYTSGFGRDPKNPSLIRGMSGWKGQIEGDKIKVWADCGWSLTYIKGKLTNIGTPKNKNVRISRDSAGFVTDVTLDATILLKVKRNAGDIVEGLEIEGGRLISLEQAEKPRLQFLEGKTVVAAKDLSLGKVVMVNGKEKTFEYEPTPKLQPALKITDTENAPRMIVWDPASRTIDSDEGWTYEIKKSGHMGNAAIYRSKSDGQSAFWHLDSQAGKETIRNENGSTTITKYTSGMLAGRTRSVILEDKNGKIISTTKRIYDEKGNSIRTVISKGDTQDIIITKSEGNNVIYLKNNIPFLKISRLKNGNMLRENLESNHSQKYTVYTKK